MPVIAQVISVNRVEVSTENTGFSVPLWCFIVSLRHQQPLILLTLEFHSSFLLILSAKYQFTQFWTHAFYYITKTAIFGNYQLLNLSQRAILWKNKNMKSYSISIRLFCFWESCENEHCPRWWLIHSKITMPEFIRLKLCGSFSNMDWPSKIKTLNPLRIYGIMFAQWSDSPNINTRSWWSLSKQLNERHYQS